MCNKSVQRLLLILLALTVCILPVQASYQEDLVGPDQQIQEEVVYRTANVYKGSFTKEATFQATEYYPFVWKVSAPDNGAIFVEYAVEKGDQVKTGDVLARFRLESDSITLARMERELDRMQEEFAAAVSVRKESIVSTQSAADVAQDPYEKEQLEISVLILQTQLEEFSYRQQCAIEEKKQSVEEFRNKQQIQTLTAPADGTITNLVEKNPDDLIAAGEVLVTLTRTDIRLLQVKDPVTELRYNMPVSVSTGRGDNQKVLTGRVVAAEETIAQEQRVGYAYVLLDPGFEGITLWDARVTACTVQLDNVLLVDRRAVAQENGISYITKLVDGMLQRRGVCVGITNVTDTWILTGVTEGDTLILN